MIAHVKIALAVIAVVALVAACAARSAEFEITCIEVASVTGQPSYECAQPDDKGGFRINRAQTAEPDAQIQALQKKWLEKPDLSRVISRKWVEQAAMPDEELKKRALRRAYELNGNSMCCGSIDVSNDPMVTGRSVITPETEFNLLDMTLAVPKKEKRK